MIKWDKSGILSKFNENKDSIENKNPIIFEDNFEDYKYDIEAAKEESEKKLERTKLNLLRILKDTK